MPSCFQRFKSSTKQNFLSNKKSGSTPLRYGLGAKKPILAIFCTLTPCLGTKLCPYELIFHAHIEENSTDQNSHFWFLAKNTPKLQELFKKRSKSLICPIIFHISLKKFIFQRWPFFSDLWHGIAHGQNNPP